MLSQLRIVRLLPFAGEGYPIRETLRYGDGLVCGQQHERKAEEQCRYVPASTLSQEEFADTIHVLTLPQSLRT